jgi:hypothetical protein
MTALRVLQAPGARQVPPAQQAMTAPLVQLAPLEPKARKATPEKRVATPSSSFLRNKRLENIPDE